MDVLCVSCFIIFCARLRGYQIAFIIGIMSVSDNVTRSSINDKFTLVSWNVKGLGHVIKRGRVFSHLKSLKPDVVFLQETHIGVNEQRRLRANWISQVYQAPFTRKSRGVAILFRKDIPFSLDCMTADPYGRYLMISGHINSLPITLLNIYGPNIDNPDFFRKAFDLIPDSTPNVIIGGDFNCYLDPVLDRFSTKPPPTIASVGILNDLIKTRNMVEIWRLQHPTDKEFSFYSHVHKSYTRIDYFLIASELLPSVTNSTYHNILISDHSPVSLNFRNILSRPKYSWRFNPLLLEDQSFIEHMNARINEFLVTNDNGEVSDSVLWEAFKVVTRGHIISFESTKKREFNNRLKDIEKMLPVLEEAYKSSLSSADYNKILKLKYEYNTILNKRVGSLLLKNKQKYFELGDKPEKLLASQLKGERAKQAIHRIKSKPGRLLTNPREINACFRDFYKELYSSKVKATEADFCNFFANLNVPQLDSAARDDLDAPFSETDLLNAIRAFPSGKTSGPDGFGCEFYKSFHDKIVPLMLRMVKDSMRNKTLPSSLYEANISLLLKGGREAVDPASYRPVALLNCDLKIITKVLATKLGRHISTIIHPNQTGFIPGRFSFSNVRLLLNTIYSVHGENTQAAILSLDAQKAFDQIEWPYMLKTLKQFGFGESFIEWVKMIYLKPVSSILTNSDRSQPFELQRGVRQGDPLSPLLFDITLEPLAIGIRGHPDIHGVKFGNVESLVNLYADDLLICLSDPVVSVPNLLNYIESFGKLSGYTINWDKCEFMPLTNMCPIFVKSLPFKLVTTHINYLGLKISRNPKLLLKLNFLDMVDKLKANIKNWKLLPLSMIGRINAIKMVALPRFLYLFQNLPIYLPLHFFKQLDSVVLSFVWADKPPRISKAHLQKNVKSGGLGLPIFRHYYWAANARALIFWQGGSPHDDCSSPLWLKIESMSVSQTSLPALLFSIAQPSHKLFGNNFVLSNSLKILSQIRKALGLPNVSLNAPIAGNHLFKPGLTDGVFLDWRKRGLRCISDFYIDNNFASFPLLQARYHLPQSHFYRYLQVRHFVREHVSDFPLRPHNYNFYDTFLLQPNSRHLISRFVTAFEMPVSTSHLRDIWSKELGVPLSEELWEEGLSSIQKCSINSRYRLIQFKVVHRLHYSKTKLNRIFESVSPMCDRCNRAEGSLSHLFWYCPVLDSFWSDIFNWFSKQYKIIIQPDCNLAIFGSSERTSTLPSHCKQALKTGMVAAKKLI